ncbi:MAG: hypothetical protein E6175_06145 [Anaerococcus sp.]|nr:hypothetical protein [Anaerococcus sp.]
MKRNIKKNLINIFYKNRFLLLISYLISFLISIQDRMLYKDIDLSIFDFLLLMYSDHYNTMYFILPIVFLVIARDIKEINDIEIIRYKNIFEFTSQKILRFSIFIFAHIFIIYTIRFISGIGYFSFAKRLVAIEFQGFNEVLEIFNTYTDYFNNGITAILCASLYLSLGLIFFYSILININYKFSYKIMVGIGITLYIMAYIGFRYQTGILSFIFLNNYLLLHQALFSNELHIFVILIIFEITILLYSFIKSYCLMKGEEYENC